MSDRGKIIDYALGCRVHRQHKIGRDNAGRGSSSWLHSGRKHQIRNMLAIVSLLAMSGRPYEGALGTGVVIAHA